MKNYAILLLFVCSGMFSQKIDQLKKQALTDAKATSVASIKEDYNTMLKYTHPRISKKYGEKKLKNIMQEIYRTMKAQKIKILSSEIDEVADIRKEQKEYRCLVKNTVKMNFNGRLVTLKSSLFGFYNKKKGHWYFVESNKLLNDPETIKLFSNFETEIQIPEDEHITEN